MSSGGGGGGVEVHRLSVGDVFIEIYLISIGAVVNRLISPFLHSASGRETSSGADSWEAGPENPRGLFKSPLVC